MGRRAHALGHDAYATFMYPFAVFCVLWLRLLFSYPQKATCATTVNGKEPGGGQKIPLLGWYRLFLPLEGLVVQTHVDYSHERFPNISHSSWHDGMPRSLLHNKIANASPDA